jgi:hypothetical protein
MIKQLPDNATKQSQKLLRIAKQISDLATEDIALAAALTGSVARGNADEFSDIELRFFTQEFPDSSQKLIWLESIKAKDIILDKKSIEDNSEWVSFMYKGVAIELGWNSFDEQTKHLEAILKGQSVDRLSVIVAEILVNCFILKDHQYFNYWRQMLSYYPDVLQNAIIEDSSENFLLPGFAAARWSLIKREEYFTLSDRLMTDNINLIRLLFALNRQWEPDLKWLEVMLKRLENKPKNIENHLNKLIWNGNPSESLQQTLHLICQILQLLPKSKKIKKAIIEIQEINARYLNFNQKD